MRIYGAWYVEKVYSDPWCVALVSMHVYEVGRCAYDGLGGFRVHVLSSDALVVHACFDSDCSTSSLLSLSFSSS